MTLHEFLNKASDFFSSLTDFRAAKAGLEAKITELEGKLTASEASIATMKAEADKSAADLKALQAQKEKDAVDLAAANAALVEANQKLADPKSEGSRRAAEILSSVGAPPVKQEPQSGEANAESNYLAQYNAIKDPVARGKFYSAHKDKILKGK